MKYSLFILTVMVSTAWSVCLSQDMVFYADAMTNADLPENRVYAAAQFRDTFEARLQEAGSFYTPFDEVKWISIQYPADSSFRCFSWQVDRGDGDFEYQGYIQLSDSQFITFDNSSNTGSLGIHDSFSWKEWDGGLIYKIHQMNRSTYTLFVYRQLNEFTKMKSAEVLMIEGDNVHLGLPVFQTEEGGSEFMNRLVLKYSFDSNVALSYVDASDQVVFDNLVSVMGRLPGQGPTMVSDGSYKAYRLEDGRWMKIEKLFDQVLERPPRAGQKGPKRDLFGRVKN